MRPPTVGYWIGLSDRVTEGVYLWETTQLETNYTYWFTGSSPFVPPQPDSGTFGNCVILNIDSNYEWCDISCNHVGNFYPLCMKEPNS